MHSKAQNRKKVYRNRPIERASTILHNISTTCSCACAQFTSWKGSLEKVTLTNVRVSELFLKNLWLSSFSQMSERKTRSGSPLCRWTNSTDINPTKKIFAFYHQTKYKTIQLCPDEDICLRFVLVFLTVCPHRDQAGMSVLETRLINLRLRN